MPTDPLDRAALHRAVALSADIELQLLDKENAGTAPICALLARAQDYAAAAIVRLAEVDPEQPKAIRELQNKITCFDLVCSWLSEIVADGFEAGKLLSDDDRADFSEALGLTDDEADDLVRTGVLPQE